MDERMNGSCAGGTGAFIDQMATLLDMSVHGDGRGEPCRPRSIYPIASRCGVFAKTDMQPLLNQGAAKADVAASIYQAVVNQTIAGLAQGRAHRRARCMFLGGPLHYCKGLRRRFRETLKLSTKRRGTCPNTRFMPWRIGAAMYASHGAATLTMTRWSSASTDCAASRAARRHRLPPLFAVRGGV